MLVSFTLENYKSFRSRTTLELSPGRSRNKSEHISNDCLRITSIFGANASGKSNLISGMRTMREIVTNPYFCGSEPLYNWDSKDKITKFEIVFTCDNEFQYRYMLDVQSIGNTDDRPSKCIFVYPVIWECLFVSRLKDGYDRSGNLREKKVFEQRKEPWDDRNRLPVVPYWFDEVDELFSYHEEIARLRSRIEFYNNVNPKNREAKHFVKRFLNPEYTGRHHRSHQTRLTDVADSEQKADYKIEIEGFTERDTDQFFYDLDFILPGTSDRFKAYLLKQDEKSSDPTFTESYDQNNGVRIWRVDEIRSMLLKMLDRSKKRDNGHLNKARKDLRTKIEDMGIAVGRLTVLPLPLQSNQTAAWNNQANILSYQSKIQNDQLESDLECRNHIDNVFGWFSQSLYILGTSDVYIPKSQEGLESESDILESLDFDIKNLQWRQLKKEELRKVEDSLSVKDLVNLEKTKAALETAHLNPSARFDYSLILKTKDGLYRFCFNLGNKYGKAEELVEELQPINQKGEKQNLFSESDGTVRMIELAAILVHDNTERTFIIDELDRRIHPLLTYRFVELFLEDRTSSKQLIFTTHETEILTTDLFRKDEIWFVDKDERGQSHIEPLDTLSIRTNKHLGSAYLRGESMPGAPRIKDRR